MCNALLFAALVFLLLAPARAQEGACPDSCPKGYVRSVETGKCVPIALMV